MRVLFLHQSFPSHNEEGSGRAYDFARQLVHDGHAVTIVAGQFSYLTGDSEKHGLVRLLHRERHPEGFSILRAWTTSGYHASYLRRTISLLTFMLTSLYAVLRAGRHDVIVATSPPITIGMVGGMAAVLTRTRLVLEIRDLWSQAAVALGVVRNGPIFKFVRMCERALQREAELVVVNSPGFVPYLVQDGVAERHIRLVPNGVDTSLFHPFADGAGVRKTMGLEGAFVAVYAGAIGLANDISTILRAAELLREETDVHFLLVGDGNRRKYAEEEAVRLGLRNVHFTGSVPKQEVANYLCASDVGVCTLRDIPLFRTVYPNKVFDYMACGLPVLVLVDGVIREVVERAEAGLFVKPEDAGALAAAIRQLRSQPQLRRHMGASGRAIVARDFDRWACARMMARVVDEIGTTGRGR